jgi:diguanylate cyclase (GGDEF)-like protein/PAS domain S-box-containing protein
MKPSRDGAARARTSDTLWLAAVALTLVLSALLAFGLIHRMDQAQAATLRTARVERELGQLLQLTVDLETAVRGFAMTRDPAFTGPAVRALPAIDAQLAVLRGIARDSVALAPTLPALEDAVRQQLALARAVQASVAGGAPVRVQDMREGKALQDRIRRLIAALCAHEDALGERSVAASHDAQTALEGAILLSTLVLGVLGGLWFRARRRLARSQDNYRRLFSASAHGMALLAGNGRIIRSNASYAAMLGYGQAELEGYDFVQLKHPDERAHARAVLRTLLDGEHEVVRNERRYLNRSGAVVWVRSTLSRTTHAANGAPLIMVVAEDISERVRQEELLRRSTVQLQNAGRMAAIDGWFLALPDGALQLGADISQRLGIDAASPAAVLERLSARSRRVLVRALAACRRAGRGFDVELTTADAGAPLVLRVMGQPAHGPHGVEGIDGAVQEITSQKRIQRELADSERRFRAAAQVTNDGIWDWDAATGTTWRSESVAVLLGMPPEQLRETPDAWLGLIHPDDRDAVRAVFERARRGLVDDFECEYRVRRADGSEVYVSDQGRVVRTPDGTVARIVGGLRDRTERRRTQLALMGMAASVPNGNSTAFFQTLLAHLLEAIGADGGAIARPDPAQPGTLLTLAALADGVTHTGLRYQHDGSPCARLRELVEYIVPDGLAAQCPQARGLPGLAARGYAGRRLEAAGGGALGVVFVLFRTPIADPEAVAAVLRVFAARAGAELERMDGAARMREQAALLDQAREAIVVLGLDLSVRFWNQGAAQLYGKPAHQMLGRPVLDCYQDAQEARAALAAVLERGEWRGDMAQRGEAGALLAVDESWTVVRDDAGAPLSILKVGTDVTENRAAEARIRQMAYYDTLTGLPNRRLLMDRLRQMMLRNERRQQHGALLFIDMDNFKSLNDQHGHDAGDEFLREAAVRLRSCVRADDTVARLGGDEFVILLDGLDADADAASQQARAVGMNVVNAFRRPVQIGVIEHRSTASVGVVLVGETDVDAEALLRRADHAMYQIKNGGRNAVALAGQHHEDEPAAQMDDLNRALEAGEFELWLLPEVERGGAAVGAIASLRWRRTPDALIDSGDFVPLAERCGLLRSVEDWTWRRCAQILAQWQRSGAPERRLSLGLSEQQLRDPLLAERLLQTLAAHGCGAAGLALDLALPGSESAAMANNLARLRAAGVWVSVGAVGLDRLSLERLRNLAPDALRLDPDAVGRCTEGTLDSTLLRATLGLAGALGLDVVADAVATPEQQQFLVDAGCRYLRGPLFGAAAPALAIG